MADATRAGIQALTERLDEVERYLHIDDRREERFGEVHPVRIHEEVKLRHEAERLRVAFEVAEVRHHLLPGPRGHLHRQRPDHPREHGGDRHQDQQRDLPADLRDPQDRQLIPSRPQLVCGSGRPGS